jgi:hypothetical protein
MLFAIHLALASRANTITWDEPDHIYAGYMSWKDGFGLTEHPPLVKFVATLPLLGMQLNVPRLRSSCWLWNRRFFYCNSLESWAVTLK